MSAGLAAAMRGAPEPTRRPDQIGDPRTLRRAEVGDFDPIARIGAALGPQFTAQLRAHLSRYDPGDLLDRCAGLEVAARDLRRALERVQVRAARGDELLEQQAQREQSAAAQQRERAVGDRRRSRTGRGRRRSLVEPGVSGRSSG